MKTPEEIKKGLECGDCKNCPYKRLISCTEGVREDALDYIQQLEAENAELKRELGAAFFDLEESSPCFACKHFYRNGGECNGGKRCMHLAEIACRNGGKYSGVYWEWRGPCGENGGKPEPPKEEEK